MTTQTGMSLLIAGDQQKNIRDQLPLEKTQPGGSFSDRILIANHFMLSSIIIVASFPGPAHLFVTCSTEKRGVLRVLSCNRKWHAGLYNYSSEL